MRGPIRVVIVDDEPIARQTVAVLARRDPELEVVGECTGTAAVALVRRVRPDLLFLDVQMPEVDGFDVLEQLADGPLPAVVFVTAYDRYALRAFEVHALDYLLKPFDDERFFSTVNRAKQQIRAGAVEGVPERLLQLLEERLLEPRSEHWVQRFLVRRSDRLVLVRAEEVDWIEAADYYAELHVGAQSHLVRRSLNDLERSLDPACFVRIHRSTIVNLDRVKEIFPDSRGEVTVVLKDGTRLRASRSYRVQFERTLLKGPR